jgi:glycosyltransferase involved in cell wall biosynthesis
VIQEAFFYCRPVIGSNIGGTAEKIDDCGGLTFTARTDTALAGVMQKAMGNASLHQALLSLIFSSYPNLSEVCANSHKDLYEWILKAEDVIKDITSPTELAQ